MRIRSTCSTIVAAGLTLAMAPLACGGAQEEYPRTAQSQEQTSASATNEWVMPEAVVQTLRGCVKEHAAELKTYSHETKFDLTVNDDGAVQGVKLHSSTLHHEAIESCLSQALSGLSIPPSMFPMRSSPSSQPFSGGESMRDTRAPLGIAQALGGVVTLGPLILIAAGVTLGVYIVAVTAQNATSPISVHCQEVKNDCITACSRSSLPTGDFGFKFWNCVRRCMATAGC